MQSSYNRTTMWLHRIRMCVIILGDLPIFSLFLLFPFLFGGLPIQYTHPSKSDFSGDRALHSHWTLRCDKFTCDVHVSGDLSPGKSHDRPGARNFLGWHHWKSLSLSLFLSVVQPWQIGVLLFCIFGVMFTVKISCVGPSDVALAATPKHKSPLFQHC